MLFAYGHKNHDASHLSSSLRALNATCNANGHVIKEMIADVGSVEESADVKLTCSEMCFAMLPQPTDMQYLNYVERSVQTITRQQDKCYYCYCQDWMRIRFMPIGW
jgi:hypothetical protein